MKLSVVIPAFNESENIQKVIEELVYAIKSIQEVSTYEIIVCDDHSTDNTFNTVKNSIQANVKAIRLSRRSGSHTAIRAGIHLAKGDAILCISADGQDNPSVLQQMIQKMKEGCNTVWAVRTNRDEPFLQKYSAKLFYTIFNYLFHSQNTIDLSNADFFLIDRKVANGINACNERNTALIGLLLWLGFKQDFVKYERRKRMSGKSKWDFKSKWKIMKDSFIAFSGLPIKWVFYIGLLTTVIGVMNVLFYWAFLYLGYPIPYWSLNVITTLLTSGVQMIMIGGIGEYLWRTLDETRRRPLFLIEDQTE